MNIHPPPPISVLATALVTFLTEETAIRIKNNIVQLVLTSNISRNTLDHTSTAPEQVDGAHQAFMNKQGCPDNFGGQNFQLPSPPPT